MKSGVAVVTGGTSGIGLEIMKGLVERGYRVMFTYRTDEQQAAVLLRAHGAACKAIRADFEDEVSVAQLIEELRRCEDLDVLVQGGEDRARTLYLIARRRGRSIQNPDAYG